MQGKEDAAEKQRKEAEERRREAEKALADAKKQSGTNASILSRAEKAEAELAEAKALGVTDGSTPGAFCTRAQAAVMTLRASKK